MAVVLGMTACNDVEQIETQETNNSSILAVQAYQNLSSSDIQQIANLHNTFLVEAEQSIDWTSSTISSDIEPIFMQINSNVLDLTSQEKEDYLDFIPDYNSGYDFLSENLTASAISIIDDAADFVTNTPNFTFANLQAEVASLKLTANNTLSGQDLDAVLIFLAVLEKSGDHWLPVDLGGSGSGGPGGIISMGEALLADATGATGVFMGIGLTLLATPATGAALLAAVGWAAAWSSAWAVGLSM